MLCSALFIDLSKSLNTITLLVKKLCVDFGDKPLHGFWATSVKEDNMWPLGAINLSFSTQTSVPQGSILGPILFSIYRNDTASALPECKVHLHADATVLYFAAAIKTLQSSFNALEVALITMNMHRYQLAWILVCLMLKESCIEFQHTSTLTPR